VANGHLLTAQEVAELLQVKASWVYMQARSGVLPHFAVGRHVRFDETDIWAWLERHRRAEGAIDNA
jgi:excisionase family DNA binding protein